MKILKHLETVGRSLARRVFPHKLVSALEYDPYDKEACANIANKHLDEMLKEPDTGALAACQRILAIIGGSYPTERLEAAYFANLKIVLDRMPRLEHPGQLVIGLGPGRCGSTSLAAMLATVANSCCTHESPPLIFWEPQSEQIDFHIKRFRVLTHYHSLVGDVSHWWLNSIGQVFDQFPDARAIGLIRDPDDCALSFMRIQGHGKGSYNPWVGPGISLWRSGHWDPTYPSYPVPSGASKAPDRAKLELITRYVKEYNSQLERLAQKTPDRVKLVLTEELSREAVQQEIFHVAGARGQTSSWKLNVKGIVEGRKIQIKF